MASLGVGLIQDQNRNVRYNGAYVVGKNNVNKSQKKGGLGGRKPLGDLSNSVEPSKRNNGKNFSVIGEQTESKFTTNVSKKKNIPKAPEKAQIGGRKALCDISNSGKPVLHKASKTNHRKLSVSEIAEEQFLHNHEECVKAQMNSMDMDHFLKAVGLDFSKDVTSPSKTKPESPIKYLELEDMVEHSMGEWCPWKHELIGKLDFSPPPCKTPISPTHFMHRNDYNYINFMLMETP